LDIDSWSGIAKHSFYDEILAHQLHEPCEKRSKPCNSFELHWLCKTVNALVFQKLEMIRHLLWHFVEALAVGSDPEPYQLTV
jgi:hypothetical protein